MIRASLFLLIRYCTPEAGPSLTQRPDTPKKSKKVTWIDGDSSHKANGTTLQDPSKVMPSVTSLTVQELRQKWKKFAKKEKNVKNKVKKHPKKKRKTFQITSDSSESEYWTDTSQNTDFNESSDGWDSESEPDLSPDPKWDDFLSKLLSKHKTPKKTSTQV